MSRSFDDDGEGMPRLDAWLLRLFRGGPVGWSWSLIFAAAMVVALRSSERLPPLSSDEWLERLQADEGAHLPDSGHWLAIGADGTIWHDAQRVYWHTIDSPCRLGNPSPPDYFWLLADSLRDSLADDSQSGPLEIRCHADSPVHILQAALRVCGRPAIEIESVRLRRLGGTGWLAFELPEDATPRDDSGERPGRLRPLRVHCAALTPQEWANAPRGWGGETPVDLAVVRRSTSTSRTRWAREPELAIEGLATVRAWMRLEPDRPVVLHPRRPMTFRELARLWESLEGESSNPLALAPADDR